jgi:hypothetical protein
MLDRKTLRVQDTGMKQTFTKTECGQTFTGEARSEDGGRVWRWTENGAVCPLDACREYRIPCDPSAQAAAREAEVAAFLAAYRRNPPRVTAEQLAEMRAAFGTGARVVDVITGEETLT